MDYPGRLGYVGNILEQSDQYLRKEKEGVAAIWPSVLVNTDTVEFFWVFL